MITIDASNHKTVKIDISGSEQDIYNEFLALMDAIAIDKEIMKIFICAQQSFERNKE